MVKRNKEGWPIVKWKDVEVPHRWHINPRSELNRIYAITSYTSEDVWNSIPKHKRKALFKRKNQLRKQHYWGGPRKPFFIKKS
jgi:hypothetical protein